MCAFKNHAFIYFLRPPSWSGTIPTIQYLWNFCSDHIVVRVPSFCLSHHYESSILTTQSSDLATLYTLLKKHLFGPYSLMKPSASPLIFRKIKRFFLNKTNTFFVKHFYVISFVIIFYCPVMLSFLLSIFIIILVWPFYFLFFLCYPFSTLVIVSRLFYFSRKLEHIVEPPF